MAINPQWQDGHSWSEPRQSGEGRLSDGQEKRRFLLLSPFFSPEMISTGKYNSRLCTALLETGHSVTVVTSYPLYPDWRPGKTVDAIPGIEVRRGGLWMRYPRHAVPRRLLLELWFSLHCLVQALRHRGAVDTVVAVLPPSIFPLLVRLVLPKSVKMIAVVHDLQGIMAESAKSHLRSFVARVMRRIEALSLKCCDKVICLSRSMRDELANGYRIDAGRLRVSYPFLTIREGQEGERLKHLFPEGFRHVVYSGALGEKQMPRELLKFFEHFSSVRDDVVCHIFSRGPTFDGLRAQYQREGRGRVRFHHLVPEEALEELYARSDVQVIPQAEGTGAGAFPSKLPNLIAAGVPLFVICDEVSEIAAVTREAGAGAVVSGFDIDAWTETLEQLLTHSRARPRSEQKAAVSAYVKEHFSIETLIAELVEN